MQQIINVRDVTDMSICFCCAILWYLKIAPMRANSSGQAVIKAVRGMIRKSVAGVESAEKRCHLNCCRSAVMNVR